MQKIKLFEEYKFNNKCVQVVGITKDKKVIFQIDDNNYTWEYLDNLLINKSFIFKRRK